MQNWIVETLTLVRRHAAESGLENLTEEMDIALLVAAEEFERRKWAADFQGVLPSKTMPYLWFGIRCRTPSGCRAAMCTVTQGALRDPGLRCLTASRQRRERQSLVIPNH